MLTLSPCQVVTKFIRCASSFLRMWSVITALFNGTTPLEIPALMTQITSSSIQVSNFGYTTELHGLRSKTQFVVQTATAISEKSFGIVRTSESFLQDLLLQRVRQHLQRVRQNLQ